MLMVIDTLKIYILKICLIIELMFMLGILVNANVYTNLFIPSKLKHLYLFYNKIKKYKKNLLIIKYLKVLRYGLITNTPNIHFKILINIVKNIINNQN